MWQRFFAVALLAGLSALAACAGEEKAPPAPAAPAPEVAPAWQEEWERVLAAAKREGRVAVVTSGAAATRRALTEPFQKKYGITVELITGTGAEQVARIRTERAAGQYLWDVFTGGASTPIANLKPIGALDPLALAFILPEVKDPKNWFDGRLPFVDADRTVFMTTLSTSLSFVVNPALVRPEEMRSYKELLDPKWKGKIVVNDPRFAGTGQATFHQFYAHKDLGPDFIRALAKQELVISRDRVMPMEWVAQGRNAIFLGADTLAPLAMVKKGVPIRIVDPRQVKEGGHMSSAASSMALMNKAPHPNAARLYINWLLSKEGQTEYSKYTERPSLRLDVTREFVEPLILPEVGFFSADSEERLLERERVLVPFLREVFGQ